MKKWHKVALAVIVIIGILIAVKSCVDKKNPDITFAYIGDGFVNREAFEENVKSLDELVEDIDSDGEKNVDLMEISFNEELGAADRQNAMQKMANALGQGAARVYFIEEKYVINNAEAGVFADISDLGEGYKNSDGETVAISIKDNKKVSLLGIDTDEDIYLAVRIVSEIDELTDKHIDEKHESAMNIARYILN